MPAPPDGFLKSQTILPAPEQVLWPALRRLRLSQTFAGIFCLVSGQRRTKMFASITKLLKNEDGATAIEYGLIAALIAVAAIGAFTAVGTSLTATFNNVAGKL
jgi:pilus assembly protein Flp/PilA